MLEAFISEVGELLLKFIFASLELFLLYKKLKMNLNLYSLIFFLKKDNYLVVVKYELISKERLIECI